MQYYTVFKWFDCVFCVFFYLRPFVCSVTKTKNIIKTKKRSETKFVVHQRFESGAGFQTIVVRILNSYSFDTKK